MSAKAAAKFPYPDNKPPIYKKIAKLDAGLHTENLTNVYKTTRDVAAELQRELRPYLEKARARVHGLVEEVNKLKQQIRDLKAELKQVKDELAQTKEALEKANSTALHPALLLIDGDPAEWSKKDEITLPF
ncbi:hypothetical protein B0T16DRAFT_391341 [Cercophora newfieldiana]|uniref:Uncharacterized protein n=1 Tax=Cercophora newfieldiana TaxID=92897 RepID=A0AA40CRQ1_9PEZI|nr:hypothetical protein B0T16DRAFT_391341 [Cercophora newfieldiana]